MRTQYEAAHAIGTKARLALALLLCTGTRRSDVVRLGCQHVRGGWITFTVQKNINCKPLTMEAPTLPVLRSIIDARPTGDPTFLVTDHGQPFTPAGFGGWFRDHCGKAGLKHCSAHGLRKAGASIAAENGASAHQLMAIFGWLTLKEAESYTQAARRRRMANGLPRPKRDEGRTNLSHRRPRRLSHRLIPLKNWILWRPAGESQL
jgi:integrase